MEIVEVLRHNDKRVLNPPNAVGICKCPYTKLEVPYEGALFLGPIVPQVNGTYACHPTATPYRNASKRLFDEYEANCNTCVHLKRIPHKPIVGGMLRGKCSRSGEQLYFHPGDCMSMQCHELRPLKGKNATN
jgi:hypothetical protein